MKKYISNKFGYSINVIVTDSGEVYTKSEKRPSTRKANCNATIGGKWEQKPANFLRGMMTNNEWLDSIDAVAANFKGSPKGVEA